MHQPDVEDLKSRRIPGFVMTDFRGYGFLGLKFVGGFPSHWQKLCRLNELIEAGNYELS